VAGKRWGTRRVPCAGMTTDAVRTVVSIAAGNHSVTTRRSAVASGMTLRNLSTAIRRGWLDEPSPGVLTVAGSPDTWRRRTAIVLAAGDGHARVSHRASATLFRPIDSTPRRRRSSSTG
jgi:hypothetical protein